MFKLFALIFLIGMCSGNVHETYIDENGICTWWEGSAGSSAGSSQGGLQIPLGEKELVPTDGRDYNDYLELGSTNTAVTPNGGIVVVGAATLQRSGEVHVFVYDEDTQQYQHKHILRGTDTVADDYFGVFGTTNVGISDDGTWIVVTAYNAEVDGNDDAGKVYIFKYNDATLQYDEVQKLSSPLNNVNPSASYFGYSVSMSGDGTFIMVGEVRVNAVHVFKYNDADKEHQYVQTLEPTALFGAQFGISVAVTADGATLAVAANSQSRDGGGLYMFKYDENNQEYYEVALLDNWHSNDGYGYGMDINGDASTIVVGATGAYTPADKREGAAIVYNFNHDTNQLTEVGRLYASNHGEGFKFGQSVCISDNGRVIAVGSPSEERPEDGAETGAAYVYTLNEQTQEYDLTQRLVGSTSAEFDRYGYYMGISGNGKVLVINAKSSDALTLGSGSIFVYPYDDTSGQFEP